MHPDYRLTLAELYRREARAGIDLKLSRVERVARALGSPHRRFPIIHVAGTNGKGSVASAAAAILERSGCRVGLYTSPHLVSFRERIRIGGELVGEEEVAAGVAEVDEAARLVLGEGEGLTFFETTTLVCFLSFARHQVDIAVVEVGLGGRLDATNIADAQVAVVAPVALDHEKFLGSRLEGVAAEKAAIIKPGSVAVLARQDPGAREVIRRMARGRARDVLEAGRDFLVEEQSGGEFSFRGTRWALEHLRITCPAAIQVENAALALAALEPLADRFAITEVAVRAGLSRWRWPGRFDTVSQHPRILLDGAHNPAATRALVSYLVSSERRTPRLLLFGAMKDKRWREMLQVLRPCVDFALLTHVDGERGEDPQTMAAILAQEGWGKPEVGVMKDPGAALEALVERAAPAGEVLVTGSLFLVGEIIPRFDRFFSSLYAAEREASRSLPVG